MNAAMFAISSRVPAGQALAVEQQQLASIPAIKLLKERAPRSGFFERDTIARRSGQDRA